jgi:hypothetical protein
MGQDDTGKTPAQSEAQADTSPLPDAASPQATDPVPPASDQPVADDLLHAAHVPPADLVANVELTLDHLSTTVDLFDVPPFDYGDTGGGGDVG